MRSERLSMIDDARYEETAHQLFIRLSFDFKLRQIKSFWSLDYEDTENFDETLFEDLRKN